MLRELVEDELLVHAVQEGGQVTIDGPEVALDSRRAESVSLAMHELASNAVRYGVLGDGQGRLSVRWSVVGPTLQFLWRETGRPAGGPPGPPGFGSELLLQSLPYDLKAETRLELKPDGVSFTLAMPLPDAPTSAVPAAAPRT
ncbi:sensor histidine kinase [Sphingomonas ginkgonis]|uniref:histidine kinase n=1 Tax=Sphingomonas ginkgonis TaxID=2315330 RepID=A0A3R9YHF7_9SPHN|nr:sensor histidine kinase [Sphingomonas ginkgonis]RST30011.1 sensor histidine kinase [Sphingomonas ginkgonis]